jgi:hypothetical protein
LSRGSQVVPVLLVEVTRSWEAATAAEAACIAAMLAAKTFAQEASAARDSASLHVKDAEDQAALVEREVLERMSRAEAKNATMLVSAREDAEGLVQKMVLLEGELAVEHQACEVSEREHQEQFEEITLLQIWGSELCHAIVGPTWVRHHLPEGMLLVVLCHIEMARELAVL